MHDAGITGGSHEAYMINVGQLKRLTQNRVVKLLRDDLKYDYLGNWQDREGNSHIEEAILREEIRLYQYAGKACQECGAYRRVELWSEYAPYSCQQKHSEGEAAELGV